MGGGEATGLRKLAGKNPLKTENMKHKCTLLKQMIDSCILQSRARGEYSKKLNSGPAKKTYSRPVTVISKEEKKGTIRYNKKYHINQGQNCSTCLIDVAYFWLQVWSSFTTTCRSSHKTDLLPPMYHRTGNDMYTILSD